MSQSASIYVAGHTGLLGSAIVRELKRLGKSDLILRTHSELDLTDRARVVEFFSKHRVDSVYLTAARVGGIFANSTKPADFMIENLMIASNVIHAAASSGVRKLLFLGSGCMYPVDAPQPMPESALLKGEVEQTSEGYAYAKIAGFKLCQMYRRQYGKSFITAIPASLFGPGDSFDLQNSHVVSAILRRYHEAKQSNSPEVSVWGSGNPIREFLFVDDCAKALLFLMENYDSEQPINIGTGKGLRIADLARAIQRVVGFQGKTVFDTSKPDGAPSKVLESRRIRDLGWKPEVSLDQGLAATYVYALAEKQI